LVKSAFRKKCSRTPYLQTFYATELIGNRITLGNKVYYANQFFFKSRLVSKKSKLKLYWSIIRLIVTHSYETWVLKETIKNNLGLISNLMH